MQCKEDGKKGIVENYEEKRRKVRQFQLTSDIFFSKVMEDTRACQELVQILTGKDLVIKNVKTQYSIRNMENHSLVLDVLAEDERGRLVNVEIHPQEDEDHVRRSRYHLSSIDISFLEKGTSFDLIPEVYLIYITEKDFIGNNKGIYEIDRLVRGSDIILDNGVHELYVNLRGETDRKEQKELLRYMVRSESGYETEVFPNLARRVNLLKEEKEGIEIMCDIMEKERARGKAEGKAEGKVEGKAEGKAEIIALIRRKYQKHHTPEQAAEALELDEVYVRKIMGMVASETGKTDEELAMQLIQEGD